jgi:hypothetical protein
MILVIAAAVSAVSADTLTLRDGKTVEGSYLGGSARQIRMAVGDEIRTFDVSDVQSVRFEGAVTSAVPAVKVITADPAPAPARPILRAEQAAPVVAAAPAAPAVVAPAAPAVARAPAAPSVAVARASGPEIPAGTNITIRMIDDVDSQGAALGQTFKASVDEPVTVDGRVLVPRGADVTTKLVEFKEPGKLAGGGQLTLDLSSITVDGKTIDVSTTGVTTAGESRKGESAKVIGGTAALGAIIGAIAGGGKGAAIGAVAGGGAGTAVQVLTHGTRVRVPSETRLTFSLQQPVRIQ